MSPGRAKCWEHPAAGMCLVLDGTSPSCAVSGTQLQVLLRLGAALSQS